MSLTEAGQLLGTVWFVWWVVLRVAVLFSALMAIFTKGFQFLRATAVLEVSVSQNNKSKHQEQVSLFQRDMMKKMMIESDGTEL